MHTSKPISTISYNSKDFLVDVLSRLQVNHIISFWCFIEHIGEVDQVSGEPEKDHIHLYVEPNQRLDTMELGEKFIELVPGSSEKPLRCISWVSSKCDDFILYTLHDEIYLSTKFESRQIHYNYSNFVSSDDYDLSRRYRSAYTSSGFARNRNLYAFISNGGTFAELLKCGAISPNQVSYFDDFFKAAQLSLRKDSLKNEEE